MMFKRIGAWIINNVILTSAVVIFSLMLTLIASNALWYQNGYHSAPMFNTRSNDAQNQMVTNSVKKPQSAAQRQQVSQYDRELILELQRGLAKHGFYKANVDGLMGKNTQAAIIAFQSRYGMKITGEASLKLLTQVLQTEIPKHNRAHQQVASNEQPKQDVALQNATTTPQWATYKVVPSPRPNIHPKHQIVTQSKPKEALLAPAKEVAMVKITPKPKPDAVKAVKAVVQTPKKSQSSIGDIVNTVAKEKIKPASNNLAQNYNLQGGITKGLVLKIQQGLRNYGLSNIKVDGNLDEKTTTAIRFFQRAHKLEIDGVPSPQLLEKMKQFGTFNG